MNNKFRYLPKEKRKKILLVTDDIRVHSGVGNIGKEIVVETCHHFNWVQVGAAIKHPDIGKKIDVSADTRKMSGVDDAEVFIYPSNGYGDPTLFRNIIKQEKPDAMFLITDPRYFMHIWQMENEIRKDMPIIYLNIWDDLPAPQYNETYYESCDALLGISKQTVNINKIVLGDKAKNKIIRYVPHGRNTDHFFPITKDHKDYKGLQDFKNFFFKGEEKDFVILFNSRNIRRKSIPDLMVAYRAFLDELPKAKADKCCLVLHTEKSADPGTNLEVVAEYLFEDYPKSVIFSEQKLSEQQLNCLYNMADVTALMSSAEGWGLALTESLLTGTPIMANVNGGMQDQMRFVDDKGEWFTPSADIPSNHRGTFKEHGEWAFPVFPNNRSIQGSPPTPYIFDTRVAWEDIFYMLMDIYTTTPEERKRIGMEGYKWATGDEAGFTSIHQGKRVIEAIDDLFDIWKPRAKYEFLNTKFHNSKRTLRHKLIY